VHDVCYRFAGKRGENLGQDRRGTRRIPMQKIHGAERYGLRRLPVARCRSSDHIDLWQQPMPQTGQALADRAQDGIVRQWLSRTLRGSQNSGCLRTMEPGQGGEAFRSGTPLPCSHFPHMHHGGDEGQDQGEETKQRSHTGWQSGSAPPQVCPACWLRARTAHGAPSSSLASAVCPRPLRRE
jgi:hypothetical protein